MKKEHYRDYATEAFRLYARLGKPTYEELKSNLYSEVLNNYKRDLSEIRGTSISKPTEQAVINAEMAVEAQTGLLLDMLAVDAVLTILLVTANGHAIKKAIDAVYFYDAKKQLKRGEITARVVGVTLNIGTSESQVYRWLKCARKMFAIERGLRI